MVNFMLPALGLAALAPLTIAAPAGSHSAAESLPRDEVFSFQQWIDEIAADPEGDHLSPEEALKAAQKETRSINTEGDLFKRDIICNDKEVASVPDAVSCINQLAARGSEGCRVEYGGATKMCTIGNAQVVGVTNQQDGTESACSDVARALGGIMDTCWRADNTVQGQSYAWGNGNMAVHLAAPLI